MTRSYSLRGRAGLSVTFPFVYEDNLIDRDGIDILYGATVGTEQNSVGSASELALALSGGCSAARGCNWCPAWIFHMGAE